MSRNLLSYLLFITSGLSLTAVGAEPNKGSNTPKAAPTFADIAYGTDPKQRFDVYCPPGDGPFPVVFYIHGGGWFAGNKPNRVDPAQYLNHGVAVVAINYRLIDDAVAEHILPPITAVLGDTRRALQYCRLHASDWHLDSNKIVATGNSAGAASSLYLACEGEQANPASFDPVEQVSTKILGAVSSNAQTSFDPEHIHEWNPGCAWGYWACEPPTDHDWKNINYFNTYLSHRDKWLPVIKKYSPEWIITKETPPIFFTFKQPLPDPNPAPGDQKLVHCPLWGVGFMKVAQELGVSCYLEYPGHPVPEYKGGEDEFVLRMLGVKE